MFMIPYFLRRRNFKHALFGSNPHMDFSHVLFLIFPPANFSHVLLLSFPPTDFSHVLLYTFREKIITTDLTLSSIVFMKMKQKIHTDAFSEKVFFGTNTIKFGYTIQKSAGGFSNMGEKVHRFWTSKIFSLSIFLSSTPIHCYKNSSHKSYQFLLKRK